MKLGSGGVFDDSFYATLKLLGVIFDEEEKAGNKEFHKAGETLRASVEAMDLEEANIFLKEFLPAYYLTLDELNEN